MVYASIIDAIGDTPLVQLPWGGAQRWYAKLEYLNPGGSIKDRSARFMIEEAERRGDLQPGGTIIEASSGNQGIAAAYIGAAKGYRVIITVSDKVSAEKRATLAAFGAEVVTCPAVADLADTRGYHQVALRIHATTPGSVMLNQYFNPDNTAAHYHDTGPEIWRQTYGAITHVICAAGSSGTVSGVGKFLKEQNPKVEVIAVDAATSYRATKGNPRPYVLEGMGIDYDTPLYNERVIDRYVTVSDESAVAMLKKLARSYGILVGPSSGGVAAAAYQLREQLPDDAYVVLLFGDSGRAYLTKQFYGDVGVTPAKVIGTETERPAPAEVHPRYE